MDVQRKAAENYLQEQGIVLPLMALIIFSAVAIIAFVVDHGRQSLTLETIQRTADAAALAGARQLDGSTDGWIEAKQAAVVALERNQISELGELGKGALSLNVPKVPRDYWTDKKTEATAHPGTAGSVGDVHVSVERGTVWWDRDSSSYLFKPLEFSISPSIDKTARVVDGKWKNVINTYLIANAVRVSVTIKNRPTTFGRIFGTESLSDLTRTSIALSDENIEFDSAPLAIPYCQLLLNTDVNTNVSLANAEHLTTEFHPSFQLQRELVFTEANPKNDLRNWKGDSPETRQSTLRRRSGLTRFESYYRPPYVPYDYSMVSAGNRLCFDEGVRGSFPSCKHVTMYGTIGEPTTTPGRIIEMKDLVNLFASTKSARLGQLFAPLQDLKASAMLSKDVGNAAVNFIRNGGTSFEAAFVRGAVSGSGRNGTLWFEPEKNFPFVRTIRPSHRNDVERRPPVGRDDRDIDLTISRPTRLSVRRSGKAYQIKLQMDHQDTPYDSRHHPGLSSYAKDTRGPGAWSNPLCHHPGINGNDFDQPVRKAYAMVVAPSKFSKEGDNAFQHRYCDFKNLFQGKPQRAIPTLAESEPVIIGRVPVWVIDAQFEDLDNEPTFKAEAKRWPQYHWSDYIARRDLIKTVAPHYPGTHFDVIDRHSSELDRRSQIFDNANKRLKKYANALPTCPEPVNCSARYTCNEDDDDDDDNQCDELKKCLEREAAADGECGAVAEDIKDDFGSSGLDELSKLDDLDSLFQCFDIDQLVNMAREAGEDSRCFWNDEGHEVRNCLKSKGTQASDIFKRLQSFLQNNNLRARPFASCLSQLSIGKYDLNDGESYEPLQPLRAGWGCGGFRARLANDFGSDKALLTSGLPHSKASPTLVNAGYKP